MSRRSRGARVLSALVMSAVLAPDSGHLSAHSGPPFPIVSDRVAGAYKVSLWADPDATDDGSAGGQFWVVLQLADGTAVPPGTSAVITIVPSDRRGERLSAPTAPVNGDAGRQFAALVMDREGPFEVEARISGPRGTGVVESAVDATYDLRPPRAMLVLYLLPFLLVGVLWSKLLIARRRGRR